MFNTQYWKVSNSGIHNRGLFAACDIPEGAEVIEYQGIKVEKEISRERALEWETRARTSGEGMVYIFDLNEDYDLDGNIPNNPAKYANHHCEPNCEAINYDEKICLIALNNIPKYSELTFDYGYAIDCFFDHPCLCGAPSCPGYIVRRDQRWRVRRLALAAAAQTSRIEQLESSAAV